MYIHKLKIGNIELENNIILAPMAGITDLPFRIICKQYNPGLVCTEMVSAKALFYGDEKTKLLLNTEGEKRPISMQIFGSDIESMVYATNFLNGIADIIDINMGCPAPKVVKNGDGSRLLLDLELAGKIVKEVVRVAEHPVTVKFRKGWDADNIVAIEAAKVFEQAGASAITIHGRTRTEYYSGKSDLDIIKQVKDAVSIPVIGNGDLRTKEDVKKAFEKYNVDAVMIGRGAFGNPWLFREAVTYMKDGRCDFKVSNEEKLQTILKHIDLEVQEKGEFIAVREMRKHISAYTKNLPNSSVFRSKINTLDTREEVEECLKEYFKEINS